LGGTFLSMASHGTDQLIVQRLLTTKDLKMSQKAVIASGVIIIIQFAVFLLIGIALYAFYGTYELSQIGIGRSDEIFPKFIVEQLPVGISGIIIAGLFAAAMSTLAGSISSLSSSTMLDLYKPVKRNLNPLNELKISRLISIFWAVVLVSVALVFLNSTRAVIEIALSIASFTYGGLLGTFLLGIFVKDAKQQDALTGFTAGILVMTAVIFLDIVAWTWFTLVGVIVTITIGKLISVFTKSK